MKRESKFDKLDTWLKTAYDQETEGIEDSLSDDGSFDPQKVNSEELLRRIQAQISKQEENAGESEVPKKKTKINRYQMGKWVALFFVSMIAIFLASMTSRANRSYLMDTVRYLIGNEMILNENNGRKRTTIKTNEAQQLKQEIEDRLGISMPVFLFDIKLSDDTYNIQYGNTVATIEYQYNDSILNLRMYNKNNTDVASINFQGEIIKHLSLQENAIDVTIIEIKDSEDKDPRLAAQWEYKNGYYQLSGKIEKSDFIKILENISY